MELHLWKTNGIWWLYRPIFYEELDLKAQEHSEVGQFYFLHQASDFQCHLKTVPWMISHQSSHEPLGTIITFVLVIHFTINI